MTLGDSSSSTTTPHLRAALVLVLALGALLLSLHSKPADLPLDGTHWRLVALDRQPLPDTVESTISFEDGFVDGFTACNEFLAEYELRGSSFTVFNYLQHQRACPPPLGAMDRDYSAALHVATGIELSGTAPARTMIIKTGRGLLEFRETGTRTPQPYPLERR